MWGPTLEQTVLSAALWPISVWDRPNGGGKGRKRPILFARPSELNPSKTTTDSQLTFFAGRPR